MTTATVSASTPATPYAGTPGNVPVEDVLAINTIRTLSMDAVQAANSGHPGTPMALAPVAYALWQNDLKFDPADPLWPNRDRFVLSNGHACMLLYSLLHLSRTQEVGKNGKPTGKPAVPLESIKAFRQLDSLCPGHPEHGWTSGLETTTGPLGQGLGNSVGMAMASKWLAATFNRPGYELFNFRTYAICGDGCMMEGISGEAASIAGHLQLDNLVWIYDNNRITIEGATDLAYSDDPSTRFLGYGWNVLRVGDANDLDTVVRTLAVAAQTKGRPTLIVVDSHIGFGSARQDTCTAHGEPLGEEVIRKTKKLYGWPEDAKFLVPDGVMQRFAEGVGKHGREANAAWKTLFANYAKQFPDLAKQLQQMWSRELPQGWDSEIPVFPADAKGMASRVSGGKVLNAIAKKVPWMIGGSADLTPSTKTAIDGAASFQAGSYGGRNLHFGIREHAMGALCNGLALSGLRPYGSGFMIFSDYMRGSMRLSAFMDLPVIYVFTHDSIGVGEDGPTHQPIEQLPGLRAVPGLLVFRPADANETAECWRAAMTHTHATSVLALTRQDLPTIDRSLYAKADGCAKGAYVLSDAKGGAAQAILIGTGSEVNLCLQTQELLAKEGIATRVVSMPCWQLFQKQDQAYRDSVLPPAMRTRIAVEMSNPLGWERWVGLDGAIVGMHTFGASAPFKQLLKKFGFEPEPVAAVVRATIARNKTGAAR
ncbi:MAG: transketolase [Planctomycetes bacterium]|nr:transketolase [Planctomycetota bacterium]